MTSKEIRQKFLDFFENKGHKIVPSSPMVNKDDPTLMFINAGMNQFKDYFLGNKAIVNKRVADTQKCLRVSGKHNDLEEVGRDSYHHTMFEMLGNWSFGDYFKEEAIAWAWELLTEVYKLDKDRLYVSVFEGDADDNLECDEEAIGFWKKWVPEERILKFDRKDNFWEMGETGPCGPCSEIHIDLRNDAERSQIDGASLVNMDHPHVIEIWNLVFIQFNRMADKTLQNLPHKHIDTGMGFERISMAVQGKLSNYDTDVFTPYIQFLEKETGKKYNGSYASDAMVDIAMRVVVDHVRAVSFAIADSAIPSNTGAGYVIRRILRRAIRYYYSFLDVKQPLIYKMVPLLADNFKDVFPELKEQVDFVSKVILSEEESFLKTLESGLKRLDQVDVSKGEISGDIAFELFDTYGFPIDLTNLIAEDKGLKVDMDAFEKNLLAQKDRSRSDAQQNVGDWTILTDEKDVTFVGYDQLEVEDIHVIKYRTVENKKGQTYQAVLNKTPFYAEGGGQIGDTGFLHFGSDAIKVLNTVKENDLIIHELDRIPENIADKNIKANVDEIKRRLTENNHSATHLLHAALRKVLGKHVQQKGSLVKDTGLRFDFAHFQKMTDEQIAEVEGIVNTKIREDIDLKEQRALSIKDAEKSGAMMLFGEKYGDVVRMITFDDNYSKELCGGCHVPSTGKIGLFKITSEGGTSAGVRRIEAVTADDAENYINSNMAVLNEIKRRLKGAKDPVLAVQQLQDENKALQKELEALQSKAAGQLKEELKNKFVVVNGINVLSQVVKIGDAKQLKTLVFQLEKEKGSALVVLGASFNGKPQLMVMLSKDVIRNHGLHAGKMIKTLAAEIKGGGGGQPFFASAGGADASGLQNAIDKVISLVG